MENLPVLQQYPSISILTLCSSGMAKLWTGKLNQGADLTEKQSDKKCDFCYFVWSSFCFFFEAEPRIAVMAPLQAQNRTQLTLVSSFILKQQLKCFPFQMLLGFVPVRVVGVLGIADVGVAVAHAAPSNADILDAVVVLQSTRKAGHYYFYKPDS